MHYLYVVELAGIREVAQCAHSRIGSRCAVLAAPRESQRLERAIKVESCLSGHARRHVESHGALARGSVEKSEIAVVPRHVHVLADGLVVGEDIDGEHEFGVAGGNWRDHQSPRARNSERSAHESGSARKTRALERRTGGKGERRPKLHVVR